MYFSTQFELATTIYTHDCGDGGGAGIFAFSLQYKIVECLVHFTTHTVQHIVYMYCGVYCWLCSYGSGP